MNMLVTALITLAALAVKSTPTPIDAPILQLPSQNATLTPSTSNSTLSLDDWPRWPLRQRVSPNIVISIGWTDDPGTPERRQKIANSLTELRDDLQARGTPEDPMFFNKKGFRDIVLDLKSFSRRPRIVRVELVEVLGTVLALMEERGFVRFSSEIEVDGQRRARFSVNLRQWMDLSASGES